jgi:hypothetical protein
MSKHLGDFDLTTVIYGKFTTFRPSTGAAYTLAGTPVLSVYKNNSTTQSTTGVTLTADFDSVTGLNHFAIDTSADGTFYSTGGFFDIVITTGTVDSVSVVGSVVGSFTLRANSALKPTTAGETLDVGAVATDTEVATAVMSALNTDTFAEPGQGTPAATTTLVAKIGYLYKNWRNRKTQTSTTWNLYNDDATTVDQKSTVADDGTTGSKTEVTTGP